MKRINTLFYCTFFDARKQRPVIDVENGVRLCRLISSEDFARFLALDVTIAIVGVFHDVNDPLLDDMDVSYDNGFRIARGNARALLSTFSWS